MATQVIPPPVRRLPIAGSGEIECLGYRFHPLDKASLLNWLFADRRPSDQVTLASANLHGLYMFERWSEYRQLHARGSTHVMVDGMPVIWLLRALGFNVRAVHRTTWLDWLEEALDGAAASGKRIFILGHSEKTLQGALDQARRRWPDLVISGSNGYFQLDDAAACQAKIAEINAFQPDIVVIGMGMPMQEIFAARWRHAISAPLVALGGAAFAYLAGDQASPPRWMGRCGLEWLHRLVANPKRLSWRYLVEPLLLAIALSSRLARRA